MKSSTIVSRLALGVGLLVLVLGAMCVISPSVSFEIVAYMQDPPAIWLAALIRISVGVILLLAAAASRTPWFFKILGGVMLVGGIATLFVGQQMGHAILDHWARGGDNFVRVFGGVIALALGPVIVWSSTQRRK